MAKYILQPNTQEPSDTFWEIPDAKLHSSVAPYERHKKCDEQNKVELPKFKLAFLPQKKKQTGNTSKRIAQRVYAGRP